MRTGRKTLSRSFGEAGQGVGITGVRMLPKKKASKKPLFRDCLFFAGRFVFGNFETGCLFGFGLFGQFFETINPTGRIDHLFLAGIERMTLRTDFRMHFFYGGTGHQHCSAGTGDSRLLEIGWMDMFFHKPCISRQK